MTKQYSLTERVGDHRYIRQRILHLHQVIPRLIEQLRNTPEDNIAE